VHGNVIAMTDLLFKCPTCGVNLAVDASSRGQVMSCSACGASIQVPMPDIAFRCEKCQTTLCAARDQAGNIFECSECSAQVTVPQVSTRSMIFETPPPEVEPALPQKQCSVCGGPVAPAAIICANCGANLITGKAHNAKHASRASSGGGGGVFLTILLLLLIGGGVWYYMRQKEESQQAQATEAQKTLEAEKEQAQKAAREAIWKKTEAEAREAAAHKKVEDDAKADAARLESEKQKAAAREKEERDQHDLFLATMRNQPFHIADANLHDIFTALPQNSSVQMRTLCSNAVLQVFTDVQQKKEAALAQYAQALETILGTLKRQNDQQTYAIVEREVKRFQAEKTVLTQAPHECLASAVAACQAQLLTADSESTHRMVLLLGQYLGAMDTLIRNAAAQNKNDEVKSFVAATNAAMSALSNIKSRQVRMDQTFSPVSVLDRKPPPSDSVVYQGHHFKVFSDGANWNWAEQKCQEMGGHLAVIHDNEGNEFVHGLIHRYSAAWIGAERAADTPWRWVNNSSFDFDHWTPGDAVNGINRKIGPAMKAVMLGDAPWSDGATGRGGCWITQPGHETRWVPAYVCEWEY